MRSVVWIATVLLCAPAAAAEVPPAFSAEEILLKSDEVRYPQLDYTVHVTITSTKPRAKERTSTYEVLVKGREHAVVKTLTPRADKGRVLLMRGHDLWAYLPTVSKPLRISLRERLIGDVANGDVARANFSGDYTPAILRQETVAGQVYDVLELIATRPDVTYGKVLLWVERNTRHPLKAEFYAISGRLLKTCLYGQYKEIAGRLRPTQLIMRDATVAGQYSTMTYERMTVEPLPDKYFTKDYMKKHME